MNQKLDWNYERYRTRDLLLEYDKHLDPTDEKILDIPIPTQSNISIIYPWKKILGGEQNENI